MIHDRVYDRYTMLVNNTPTRVSHRDVSRWADGMRKLYINTSGIGCTAVHGRNVVVLEHARSGMFKHDACLNMPAVACSSTSRFSTYQLCHDQARIDFAVVS